MLSNRYYVGGRKNNRVKCCARTASGPQILGTPPRNPPLAGRFSASWPPGAGSERSWGVIQFSHSFLNTFASISHDSVQRGPVNYALGVGQYKDSARGSQLLAGRSSWPVTSLRFDEILLPVESCERVDRETTLLWFHYTYENVYE